MDVSGQLNDPTVLPTLYKVPGAHPIGIGVGLRVDLDEVKNNLTINYIKTSQYLTQNRA
jgi:hypothetical protein